MAYHAVRDAVEGAPTKSPVIARPVSAAPCCWAITPTTVGCTGCAGTGINDRELRRLAEVLAPVQVPKMPLAEPPPRDSRFGSPLKLSRVHWVRPEVVVEVTYLTWTEGGLSRAVSYQGQREDKPARQVVRFIPHSQ
jgi:ATP dependent DNA ligase C terminal region